MSISFTLQQQMIEPTRISSSFRCCFEYKLLITSLITFVILKHYYLGYFSDVRTTYRIFNRYHRQIRNDSFFDDDSWTNESIFIGNDLTFHNITDKGYINIETSLVNLSRCQPTLENDFQPKAEDSQQVGLGGRWSPKTCRHVTSVALVVPFRWREKHLKLFLPYMHLFLQHQQWKYQIFVIEQNGTGPFNRGKLMNIGFIEASKHDKFDCYIFHDVDLFPLRENILYNCSSAGPLHMAVGIDKFGERLPYRVYFGGVNAFTVDQYRKVNGFSNNFYGWGGEDDALGFRVKLSQQKLIRLPETVAKYKMIKHERDKGNEENLLQKLKLLDRTADDWRIDGLNSLKYDIVKKEYKNLYTKILVDV